MAIPDWCAYFKWYIKHLPSAKRPAEKLFTVICLDEKVRFSAFDSFVNSFRIRRRWDKSGRESRVSGDTPPISVIPQLNERAWRQRNLAQAVENVRALSSPEEPSSQQLLSLHDDPEFYKTNLVHALELVSCVSLFYCI
jgi:hypothetical protein